MMKYPIRRARSTIWYLGGGGLEGGGGLGGGGLGMQKGNDVLDRPQRLQLASSPACDRCRRMTAGYAETTQQHAKRSLSWLIMQAGDGKDRRAESGQTWEVGGLGEAGLVVAVKEVAGCFAGTTKLFRCAKASVPFPDIETTIQNSLGPWRPPRLRNT